MTDTDQASLTIGQRSIALPTVVPTLGHACVDITQLAKQSQRFTFDPGFTATASCKSSITYIDGDQGILLYRGYPIEQLAQQSNFLEVTYLLIHGELPSQHALQRFNRDVAQYSLMHESVRNFLNGFHYDAHPMAMLAASVASLSAFHHDAEHLKYPEGRYQAAVRLIGQMPTLAAAAYRYAIGWPIMYPRSNLPYVQRFLHSLFESPGAPLELSPVCIRALDLLFILHADHEQNASTSTVRMVGSTGASVYASVAAGITALWGPAHGGANEEVLRMLEEIATPQRVPEVVAKAKDRDSGFRLMGFGHRIYKNFDPRASIIRKMAHQVLSELGVEDPLLEVALKLEETALKDEYFLSRRLYPNVDFYSGLIYKALKIPAEMLTVMFAIARTAGWVSHWLEQQMDPERKLCRPRQVYTGYTLRDYATISQRDKV